MIRATECPKCGGTMEEGYATEHTTINLITRVVIQHAWLPGMPALNRYGGIDEKRIDTSKALPITMYRRRGGYLESFAGPRAANNG